MPNIILNPLIHFSDLLKLPSAVPFGSVPLGVSEEYSDRDIALLYDDLPDKLKELQPKNIENYFRVIPRGDAFLLQYEDIDIIVCHSAEDLITIRLAVEDLLKIPNYLLKDKSTRIALYEQALLHHGFVYGKA